MSERSRRRAAALIVMAVVALAVGGSTVYLRSVETDLDRRVTERAAAAAPLVASISVSGQTVTVSCSEPVLDVATLEASLRVDGVRAVEADRSCRSSRAPIVDPALAPTTTVADEPLTTPDGMVVATTVPPAVDTPPTVTATIADVLTAETSLSLVAGLAERSGALDDLSVDGPFVLFAPSDEAFGTVDADLVAALNEDEDAARRLLSRHLVDAQLDPAAIYSDEADSVVLASRDGSASVVDPGEVPLVEGIAEVLSVIEADNGVILVIDRVLIAQVEGVPDLVISWESEGFTVSGAVADEETASLLEGRIGVAPEVDAGSTIDTVVISDLLTLLGVVPSTLVEATVVVEADAVTLTGSYRDQALGEAVAAIAAALLVEVDLAVAPPVGIDDGVRVATAIEDLLLAEPIVFDSEGTEIDESSFGTLDVIASLLSEVPTARVEVRGHTDSDGVEGSNVLLSSERAEAVVESMVERGLDAARFIATGVGSAEPVLVEGVEDKTLSRRVEFVLTMP